MLADPAAAEDVAKGIAAGLKGGKGYVDISTIDGETANRIKEVWHCWLSVAHMPIKAEQAVHKYRVKLIHIPVQIVSHIEKT